MVRIIGSIDNAAVGFGRIKTIYHIVFTEGEILQFEVMNGKEWGSGIWGTQMSNDMRMVPVAGTVSNYKITQEEIRQLIEENIATGRSIEQDLDNIVKEDPSKYTRIEYSTIKGAELSNGTLFTLPHLTLHTETGTLKFHLIRSNFHGRGKLPDDVFA